MITKIRDPPTDKNVAGIKEVYQTSQHVSDHLPTVADNIESSLITFPASRVDVFRAEDTTSRLHHLHQNWAASIASSLRRPGGDRRSGCHRFQTAFVPTRAQGTVFINADMTDIPGRSITSTMDSS